jgi:hypothetical protein
MLFLYFCIFACRFTIICLKSVFKHNYKFYFVYNIYISEKCMTQMGREYIRDLFSLLQLNLLLGTVHYLYPRGGVVVDSYVIYKNLVAPPLMI